MTCNPSTTKKEKGERPEHHCFGKFYPKHVIKVYRENLTKMMASVKEEHRVIIDQIFSFVHNSDEFIKIS